MTKDLSDAVLDGDGGRLTEMQPTPDPTIDIAGLSARAIFPSIRAEVEKGVERLPTGFKLLDERLSDGGPKGGFASPGLVILGAEPKIGKSTFVQAIGENIASAGGVAYFLDLENGRKRWFQRLLCRRAKANPATVARSPTLAPQWGAAIEWLQSEVGGRIFYDDRRTHDIASFQSRIEAARGVAGDRPLFVVIDSLQKLPAIHKDRRQSIDLWLRHFEVIRDQCNAVIMVISELRRPGDGKGYKASATAYKESGDIEYTATLALSMYRKDDNEHSTAPATLCVEYGRDDEPGPVARYSLLRPYYGINEMELDGQQTQSRTKKTKSISHLAVATGLDDE